MPFDIREAKAAMWAAFQITINAMEKNGVSGDVLIDSPKVNITQACIYSPDILVQCEEYSQKNGTYRRSQIAIEIVASLRTMQDWTEKMENYFKNDAIKHYLIVDLCRRVVIHHTHESAGQTTTTFLRKGNLHLEPPGLDIPLKFILGPCS